MRFGVGVRFPVPGFVQLAAQAFARSRVGAGVIGNVALAGRATARYAWRSGLGSVPVITSASFTLGSNPGFDALVGHVDATNSPTSYAITGGNPSGYFALYNSGNMRTGLSAAPPDSVYPLTITATNSFGTSPPATVTVTVGGAPIVNDTTLNLSIPTTTGTVVGNAFVSGGAPTSYSITAGNSAGYFAINNAGEISVTATGAAGITAQTYSLTVQASNAVGSSTGTVSVVASQASGNYNNLTNWPSTANRPQWTNTGGAGTLTWTGPTSGGASTTNDVQQTLALTASGSVSSSSNGQVIEGLNISGGVSLTHNNVTLRRCYIHVVGGTFDLIINPVSGTGIVIEDCFIVGDTGGGAGTYYGISNAPNYFAANLTIRRCAMKGWDNCCGSDWSDGSVIDNLFYASNAYSSASHVDLMEVYKQQSTLPAALTIKHNTYDCTQPPTGAWASGLNVGALETIANVIIDNNAFINTQGKQIGLTYSFTTAQGGSNATVRQTTINNGIRNQSGAFWGLSGGLTRITVAADSGNFNMASDTATSGTAWGGTGKLVS